LFFIILFPIDGVGAARRTVARVETGMVRWMVDVDVVVFARNSEGGGAVLRQPSGSDERKVSGVGGFGGSGISRNETKLGSGKRTAEVFA
jgi:hypothetical protein